MNNMEKVRLVFVPQASTEIDYDKRKVQIKKYSNCDKVDREASTQHDSNKIIGKIRDWEDIKDCCICMSDLVVSKEQDVDLGATMAYTLDTAASSLVRPLLAVEDIQEHESIQSHQPKGNSTIGSISSDDIIVQTKCGHLFHQSCLAGWLGGGWDDSSTINTQVRLVRRRCCPLCREDLTPRSSQ
jgi:hypothetical protein